MVKCNQMSHQFEFSNQKLKLNLLQHHIMQSHLSISFTEINMSLSCKVRYFQSLLSSFRIVKINIYLTVNYSSHMGFLVRREHSRQYKFSANLTVSWKWLNGGRYKQINFGVSSSYNSKELSLIGRDIGS